MLARYAYFVRAEIQAHHSRRLYELGLPDHGVRSSQRRHPRFAKCHYCKCDLDSPERALREALANALIHRDYQRLGATHFQWKPDRIEISSPGGFPEGVRLDNLLVTAPHPRNPLLADAFKRVGVVERTARGIDTIYLDQLRNGRAAPSYERSDGAGVTVVIPTGEANLELVRLLVTEGQRGCAIGLDELLILSGLPRERDLTAAKAGRLIQKPEAEALAALARLEHAGLVEGIVRNDSADWHLSAAACRALGCSPSGELENQIVQFVERHGRITRKQAAGLCRLGPYQTTRLLDRLVTAGRLLRHGQRKGSWYGRGGRI